MKYDICINAENLSKVYKLYASPLQMFLDKIGLGRALRLNPGSHAALDNVNIQIRRGEKVAIIGRNGAGKSTFLKLVSGVTEPTSGTLEITGKIHALLSIGSGFHQDFTGKQNVYAYLANQGIAGKQADAMLEEIVEFAEIEDYIDQPLRTYSTGMGVRLMFATSTTIVPDILILDEVLGVGDSYFSQKSYERMREMATGHGTTLLLVTHDIYSAVSLCERVIWIDRGRVLIDGPAKDVVAAYENSIKIQEEERLRIKNSKKQKESIAAHEHSIKAQEEERLRNKNANRKLAGRSDTISADGTPLLVTDQIVDIELKPGNGMYFEAPFWLASLELFSGDTLVGRWSAEDGSAEEALCREVSQWGTFTTIDGTRVLEVLDYGSVFHKAALTVPVDSLCQYASLTARITYRTRCPESLEINVLAGSYKVKGVGNIELSECLITTEITLIESVTASPVSFAGTADIVLSNIVFLQNGIPTFVAEAGKYFSIKCSYKKKNFDYNEDTEILVAFHRSGVQEAFRTIYNVINLPDNEGNIDIDFTGISLGNDEYTVSIMMAKLGYFTDSANVFFTINNNVICSYIRTLTIKMQSKSIFTANPVIIFSPTCTIY